MTIASGESQQANGFANGAMHGASTEKPSLASKNGGAPVPVGMQKGLITKYRPFPPIDLPDRQWPSRTIDYAPIWCSVDLRDGNQALAIPMSVAQKVEMFQLLVELGFKEIEVGFPAASQIEFDFLRRLVQDGLIPDDVTIQVLVQARDHLIHRTFEALHGVKRAIVHIYNSTSELQRRVVFGMTKPEIRAIAVHGVALIKSLVPTVPETAIILQYSPESFSATELDFALEICEAVVDLWQPTPQNKLILNLPATVEVATPNVHADQIEWFCRHLRERDSVIISLHTHNDRGTGVAATELGLLAGADRVEGTLFGNGERTGNVDIVTLALNLYTQGVDPGLAFSDINHVRAVYERVTRMKVHERHPYAGDLVFTAFSGSHQDAIKKGMSAQDPTPGALWQVPYLPIDPKDVGRSYEAIIRINAQSGKGGVAYILENEFGIAMPKAMHVEFGKIINDLADARGEELTPQQIHQAFTRSYLDAATPFQLLAFRSQSHGEEGVECTAKLAVDGITHEVTAIGNGPIDAFMVALKEELVPDFQLVTYAEHSLGHGSEAEAIAYIQIQTPSGAKFFGAATDTNIERASIKAILSSLNRAFQSQRSAMTLVAK
ncbi:MAG: 2-isopropylmalate synthase [Caldilineaceae bacterium]|nr:2-isopropylmalate synthase [Caldilineaceae bacterium]